MSCEVQTVNFSVDKDKCIKCGLCKDDCPVWTIGMDEYPYIKKEENCFKCQHCFAVCPTGAISILGNNPADELSLKDLSINSEDFKRLIRGRRSVRKYKNENISKSVITELCQTALHAPTAKNTNTVHFTVIDDKEKLDKFRKIVYGKLKVLNLENMLGFNINKMVENWEAGKSDKLFATAPHMVVASAPQDTPFSSVDSIIALSYFELLANTMNIGTLWNGILRYLFNQVIPEIRKELEIPEDHRIDHVMVFGVPDVVYHRTVNRNPVHLNFVEGKHL